MNAPLIDAACSMPALGLSPWILPLIAIAAKLKENDADDAKRRGKLPFWRGATRDAAREDRSRDQPVPDEGRNGGSGNHDMARRGARR